MKYYAVRKGRTPGIFMDWASCQESVKGYKGAEFKSFTDLLAAKSYLTEINNHEEYTIDEDTLVIYVDGSYRDQDKLVGSGVVILDSQNHIMKTTSFSSTRESDISMRNVAGEVRAAIYAMQATASSLYEKVVINYDYEGIAKWCNGSWSANTKLTLEYQKIYRDYKSNGLKIYFNKIAAHTGEVYNELADILAKQAVGIANHDDVLKQMINCCYSNYQKLDHPSLDSSNRLLKMTEQISQFQLELKASQLQSEILADISTEGTLLRIYDGSASLIIQLEFDENNTIKLGDYLDDM